MAQIGEIRVTPQILREVAGDIERLAKSYQELYSNLYGKTDKLSDVWSGEDNVAFVNRIAGFKPDLEAMYSLMTRYVNYLNTTAKSYEDTQNAVKQQANLLQN